MDQRAKQVSSTRDTDKNSPADTFGVAPLRASLFFFQLFREKVSDWKEKRIIQEGSRRREFRERVEEEEEEKDRMRKHVYA